MCSATGREWKRAIWKWKWVRVTANRTALMI